MPIVLLFLVGCFPTHVYAEIATDYYRSPLAHTGYYPRREISARPQLKAKYGLVNMGIHTASKSSPIIDGNLVYVGADSGLFYALEKDTLEPRWEFRVRKTAKNGIHATATIYDQDVYIGAYDGWLYRLDKKTGRLIDQFKLGDYIGASSVIWQNKLFTGVETKSSNGYVHCLDLANDSACIRRIYLGGHTHSTPTIDAETGIIYIGANSDYIHAIDTRLQKVLWKYKTGGDIKSTAALSGDRIIFSSWDTFIYALEKSTGELLWKFKTGARSMSSPTVNPDLGLVYVGSHDGNMYAIEMETGKEKWRYKTSKRILSSGVIASDKDQDRRILVFGSADKNVYWIDAQTGALLHKAETQGRVTSVPAIHEGKVYVSGDDGFLYLFE